MFDLLKHELLLGDILKFQVDLYDQMIGGDFKVSDLKDALRRATAVQIVAAQLNPAVRSAHLEWQRAQRSGSC